ncbi:hypothetical protein LX36DRAFT_266810 [Colletotrichum falcatum]|nr:hypothetical protein LX36DRAFT_266810 [Colletotrichum falcatum]
MNRATCTQYLRPGRCLPSSGGLLQHGRQPGMHRRHNVLHRDLGRTSRHCSLQVAGTRACGGGGHVSEGLDGPEADVAWRAGGDGCDYWCLEVAGRCNPRWLRNIQSFIVRSYTHKGHAASRFFRGGHLPALTLSRSASPLSRCLKVRRCSPCCLRLVGC